MQDRRLVLGPCEGTMKIFLDTGNIKDIATCCAIERFLKDWAAAKGAKA